MTFQTDDDFSAELDAELRADAASWQLSPSASATERLQRALAEVPSNTPPVRRRRLMPFAAAAAVLVSLTVFAITESGSAAETESPLQQELGDLAEDIDALKDAFWQQLPEPLRRLGTS